MTRWLNLCEFCAIIFLSKKREGEKIENTGEVTMYQADYEEWFENGCKKSVQIIQKSDEEQKANLKAKEVVTE